MKAQDDAQRPSAGELMDDDELARPDEGRSSLTPQGARALAKEHQEAVAEGRARVGEADPDAGRNAEDHGGTIHPS